MTTLLQLGSTLATLPAPPVHTRVLFESPIATPAIAALVGVLAAIALNRAAKVKQAALALAIGLAIALTLAATSRLVTTPREQIEDRTIALVDAVAEGRTLVLRDLLADGLILSVDGDKANLGNEVEFILAQARLVTTRIDAYHRRVVRSIADSPTSGRVRFSVRVDEAGGGITFTVWIAEWRQDNDGAWRLYALDWKKLNGETPRRFLRLG